MNCTTCTHQDKPRATLVDGRQVCTWCEEWRHECEARAVLKLPTLTQRRAYLYGVEESQFKGGKWIMVRVSKGIEQVRGEAEVRRLEATMTALWKAARAAAANDNGSNLTQARQR